VSIEIDIPGANCSYCLNETIDALRAHPLVVHDEASATGQCLLVEHSGADTESLLRIVHDHLRRDEQVSAEHVMNDVTPVVAEGICSRHGPYSLRKQQ
jgi:hypothetical protein